MLFSDSEKTFDVTFIYRRVKTSQIHFVVAPNWIRFTMSMTLQFLSANDITYWGDPDVNNQTVYHITWYLIISVINVNILISIINYNCSIYNYIRNYEGNREI